MKMQKPRLAGGKQRSGEGSRPESGNIEPPPSGDRNPQAGPQAEAVRAVRSTMVPQGLAGAPQDRLDLLAGAVQVILDSLGSGQSRLAGTKDTVSCLSRRVRTRKLRSVRTLSHGCGKL